MRKPLMCPGCGATRGISTDCTYTLANGHRRRLRRCGHCSTVIRTIQPPEKPERLAQQLLTSPTAPRPRKLSAADVLMIRHAAARGARRSDLAEDYNVAVQTIQQIVTGGTWRLVGGPLSQRFCSSCAHFKGDECAFGFPEAITEMWFANECDFYKALPRSQATS